MPSVFSDMAGFGKHITIDNPSNWSVFTGVLPTGENASEKVSQTGANTFGLVGSDLSLVDRSTALEFWIRPHSDWGTGVTLIETSTITHANYQLSIQTNGLVGSIANVYCTSVRGPGINIPAVLDQWNHIVVQAYINYVMTTSSIGSISSYFNGVPGPSGSTDRNSYRPAGGGASHGIWLIGSSQISTCELAMVTWYNKTLNFLEAMNHYTYMVAD